MGGAYLRTAWNAEERGNHRRSLFSVPFAQNIGEAWEWPIRARHGTREGGGNMGVAYTRTAWGAEGRGKHGSGLSAQGVERGGNDLPAKRVKRGIGIPAKNV